MENEEKIVKVEAMDEWDLSDLETLCQGTKEVPFEGKKFVIKKLSVFAYSTDPVRLIFNSLVSPKLKKMEDTNKLPLGCLPVLSEAIADFNKMNPEQAEGNSPALL